ncbi:hypothetical protein GGF31_000238 [Allomyces arbusculus]|nr:hypothetical protein GGF31_000238 [Allomyces arbusculus]
MVVVLMLAVFLPAATAENFTLGVLLPLSGPTVGSRMIGQRILSVLNFSIPRLNQNLANPLGHNFSLFVGDTQLNPRVATDQALTLQEHGVVGLIGEVNSANSIPIAYSTATTQLFQCSGGSTANTLSDKTAFPNFFRLIGSDSYGGAVAAAAIKYFGWESVNVVASDDAYGLPLAQKFQAEIEPLGIQLASYSLIGTSQTAANVAAVLKTLASSPSRINVLFAQPTHAYHLITVAISAGLYGPGWVWTGSETLKTMSALFGTPPMTGMPAVDAALFDGLLVAAPREAEPGFPVYDQFIAQWNAAFPGAASDPSTWAYTLFTQSCLEAQVRGVLKMVQLFGAPAVKARDYSAALAEFLVPFDSVTGPVTYSRTGDRFGNFVLLNWRNGSFQSVVKITDALDFIPQAPIQWPGGVLNGTIPQWAAVYPGVIVLWSSPWTVAATAVLGVSAIVVVGTWAVLFTARNSYRMQELGMRWTSLILLGSFVSLAAPLLWVGIPTAATCNARFWLLVTAMTTMVGPITARQYAIWKWHENPILAKGITTLQARTTAVALSYSLLCGIPMFIAVFAFPLAVKTTITNSATVYSCSGSSKTLAHGICLIAALSLHGITCGLAVYFARQLRRTRRRNTQTASLYYAIRHLIVSLLLGGASAYFVIESVAYLFLVMSVACVYMVLGVVIALFGSHIKQLLFPNARNQSSSSLATRTGRTDSQKPGSVSSARRSGRYKGRNDDSKFTGSYPVKMGTGPFSRWKRMEISYFQQQELLIFATEARHPALALFPRHMHVHALAKSLVIQLTPVPPGPPSPATTGITTPAPKPAPPLTPVPSRVQIQMFHADDLAAWRSKLPGVQSARTARTASAADLGAQQFEFGAVERRWWCRGGGGKARVGACRVVGNARA